MQEMQGVPWRHRHSMNPRAVRGTVCATANLKTCDGVCVHSRDSGSDVAQRLRVHWCVLSSKIEQHLCAHRSHDPEVSDYTPNHSSNNTNTIAMTRTNACNEELPDAVDVSAAWNLASTHARPRQRGESDVEWRRRMEIANGGTNWMSLAPSQGEVERDTGRVRHTGGRNERLLAQTAGQRYTSMRQGESYEKKEVSEERARTWGTKDMHTAWSSTPRKHKLTQTQVPPPATWLV